MPRKKQDRNVSMARTLRAAMTLPEVLLWQLLRNSPDGVKFRRQHPLGPYVLDFYCAQARACIEIDGASHDRGDRPVHDAARDDWLRTQGVTIMRIPATEVLHSPEDVAEAIVRACRR